MIRVGPAGWAYKDWEGIVYHKPKPQGFDPVATSARNPRSDRDTTSPRANRPLRWRSPRQRVPAEPSILLPQACDE
jgi:hypothetical protein